MRVKMKICGLSIAAMAIALLLVARGSSAAADPPGRVNFQGMARDAGGTVLDGPVSMVFRFYDDPAAGTVLWEETYDAIVHPPAVTVSAGLFTVALGDSTHRSGGGEATFQGVFANHTAVYLGVKVGLDTEMTPRISVVSTPFAVNSGALEGKGADDFAEAVHAHDASAISTGTLPVAHGGTGLASPGASGNVLTSTGSAWASSAAPSAASTGAVVDAADTTLTRSGSGTAVSPYKLSLNLGKANTWSGAQTFQANTLFPTGNLGIGTGSPSNPIDVEREWGTARLVTTNKTVGSWLELKNVTPGSTLLGGIFFNNAQNTFPGDITFSDDEVMTLSAGFLGKVVISGNGNVGVGTDTPSANLEVSGTSTHMRLSSSAHSWGPILNLVNTDSDPDYLGVIEFNSINGIFGRIACSPEYKLLFGTGLYHKMALDNAGNLGVGTLDPGFPLTFAPETGNKISLYTSSPTEIYGFGVDSSLLQVFSSKASTDIAFGYGASANFTERMRIKGTGKVGIGLNPTYQFQLSTDSAAKPGTNTWTVASDLRLKKDVAPFTDGLEVLGKIRPISYRYNGLAGLPRDMPCIGVSAQEIRDVAPYTVGTFKARLTERDETETELYDFNSHALTFVIINAINELDERTKGLPESEVADHSGKESPDQKGTAKATAVGRAPVESSRPQPSGSAPDASGMEVAAVSTHERFPVCETVEAGDVLVADAAHPGVFCLSRREADPKVVGLATGEALAAADERGEGTTYLLAPLATSGIATCKVDAAYGPISVGDLLATSPTPGHAQKVMDPKPGTVLGKALEAMDAGVGTISVLVMLR